MMSDDRLLLCSLSDWNGEPTYCRWCNVPLGKYRRRWCSDACGEAARENHIWTFARFAALVRDARRCVECGGEEVEWPNGPGEGRPIVRRLEVHHIDPLGDGRHGQNGCWHHLDGLRTLCHEHHLEAHRLLRGSPPRLAPVPLNPQLAISLEDVT